MLGFYGDFLGRSLQVPLPSKLNRTGTQSTTAAISDCLERFSYEHFVLCMSCRLAGRLPCIMERLVTNDADLQVPLQRVKDDCIYSWTNIHESIMNHGQMITRRGIGKNSNEKYCQIGHWDGIEIYDVGEHWCKCLERIELTSRALATSRPCHRKEQWCWRDQIGWKPVLYVQLIV